MVAPLRFAVTLTHEIGHCLAALLVGGHIVSFTISMDGSGLASTVVSSNYRAAFVASAGYLGAAMFGSALLVATHRAPGPQYAKVLCISIGIFLLCPTLLLAVSDGTGSYLGNLIGIGCGGYFLAIGLQASLSHALFALNLLAIATGLHAVFDCWVLVVNPDTVAGGVAAVQNDAVQFSEFATGGWLPPRLIGVCWTLCSIACFSISVWWSVGTPCLAAARRW